MLVGSIHMYAGSVPPSKFLLCDGSAVSRTTYSELFDVVGVTFGSGDGSSTFNLPNLCGKVVIGVSQDDALGSSGGEESHVLTVAELPQHSHTVPQHGHGNTITATTPKFTHSITQPAFNYSAPNSGRGDSASKNTKSYMGTSTATASRTTNAEVSAHGASACTMSGGVSNCNAFNTSSTGSDTAHNNMQPFTALNFIIYSGV